MPWVAGLGFRGWVLPSSKIGAGGSCVRGRVQSWEGGFKTHHLSSYIFCVLAGGINYYVAFFKRKVGRWVQNSSLVIIFYVLAGGINFDIFYVAFL